jgi:hypothetical protein
MEADMKVWMGIAGVAWMVAGVVVLGDALALTASVASVLHQQYVVGQFILAAVLASFGMLFMGIAGVIDAVERREHVTTTTPHDELLAKVPRVARAKLAREMGGGWS